MKLKKPKEVGKKIGMDMFYVSLMTMNHATFSTGLWFLIHTNPVLVNINGSRWKTEKAYNLSAIYN